MWRQGFCARLHTWLLEIRRCWIVIFALVLSQTISGPETQVKSLGFFQPAREAESARAVTGRRCPHSGRGEDFFDGSAGFFFSETAVTPEQKVEKSFPRWEINRHVEG